MIKLYNPFNLLYKSGTAIVNDTNQTTRIQVGDGTIQGILGVTGSSLKLGSATNHAVILVINGNGVGGIYSGGAVVFGSNSLEASAMLQADSTTRGFLPPRMTTAQKNAIGSPTGGLIVFDTDLDKLCVYTGAAWETITSA